jgi:hypothetical protein
MIDSDIHLRLLANEPIDVGIGQFQLPTVREIIRMGESKHNEYLSMLLFNKDYLNNRDGIDEYTDLEVFVTSIFYDHYFRDTVTKAFKLFLNKEMKVTDEGVIYFDELREDTVFTEEKWMMIKKVAKIGNFIQEKKEEKIVYADDEVKSFWEKMRKKRELAAKSVKKEEKINLHSILSAVSCRTHGIEKTLSLTIYQLYDMYFRLGLIDNYYQITTGIYTGNVDQSKIKLPDINWANVIKI